MTKTEVRRLRYLADKMAKLPESAAAHFKMTHWFRHWGKRGHKFGPLLTRRAMTFCGTSACALGWAATMPYFKKLGLAVEVVGVDGSALKVGRLLKKADKIFGVDADFLFYDFEIKTPKEWAAAARKFLRDNT